MQITGLVHSVGQTEQKTDTFSVREMILVVDPASNYPAYITIQATNKNTGLFDDLKKGEEITVDLNLNGRLYTDKSGVERSFNSLVAWRVNKPQQTTQPASMPQSQEFSMPSAPMPVGPSDDLPDVPF